MLPLPALLLLLPSTLCMRARFDNGYLSIKRPLLPDLELFGTLSNSDEFARTMAGYKVDSLTLGFMEDWW